MAFASVAAECGVSLFQGRLCVTCALAHQPNVTHDLTGLLYYRSMQYTPRQLDSSSWHRRSREVKAQSGLKQPAIAVTQINNGVYTYINAFV